MTKDITKEPTTWLFLAFDSGDDPATLLRTFTGTVIDAACSMPRFIGQTENIFGPFNQDYSPVFTGRESIEDFVEEFYDNKRIVWQMIGEDNNYCETVVTYIATPIDMIDEFKGEITTTQAKTRKEQF